MNELKLRSRPIFISPILWVTKAVAQKDWISFIILINILYIYIRLNFWVGIFSRLKFRKVWSGESRQRERYCYWAVNDKLYALLFFFFSTERFAFLSLGICLWTKFMQLKQDNRHIFRLQNHKKVGRAGEKIIYILCCIRNDFWHVVIVAWNAVHSLPGRPFRDSEVVRRF